MRASMPLSGLPAWRRSARILSARWLCLVCIHVRTFTPRWPCLVAPLQLPCQLPCRPPRPAARTPQLLLGYVAGRHESEARSHRQERNEEERSCCLALRGRVLIAWEQARGCTSGVQLCTSTGQSGSCRRAPRSLPSCADPPRPPCRPAPPLPPPAPADRRPPAAGPARPRLGRLVRTHSEVIRATMSKESPQLLHGL